MSSDLEEPDWLQPGMLKDSSQDNDATSDVANERFGALIFIVAGGFTVALLCIIFLREFYWRKYGVDICPKYYGNHRRPDEQEARDRALAEELQRQLNEQEREAEREVKRNERRIWYESYIEDYTMVAQDRDLFYAHELNDPAIKVPQEEEDGGKPVNDASSTEGRTRIRKRLSSNFSEISDEELDDIESGASTKNICIPVACDEEEEDAHLYLQLPVKDKVGTHRTVDAQCAICFCEYEAGDKVVWSGLQCQHAFHSQCILPWLAKGKKRCPICRHWFVPGTRIEDQKRELEERQRTQTEDSAASSGDTDETHERGSSSDSDSENPMTTAEISTGDDEQSPASVHQTDEDVELGDASRASATESELAILQPASDN